MKFPETKKVALCQVSLSNSLLPGIIVRMLHTRIFVFVSLTVHLSITLANDQIYSQILIYLFQSSTCACFEQYLAHPQEVKLY